jgi:hypothetical protein
MASPAPRACACVGALITLASCSGVRSHGDSRTTSSELQSDDASTGSVDITADATLSQQAAVSCPGISAFSIVPAAVLVDQPAQINLSTVGPTPLVTWTVIGGTIEPSTDDAGGGNWVFQCNGPGTASVSVAVGLPDTDLCEGQNFTTYSAAVVCQPDM